MKDMFRDPGARSEECGADRPVDETGAPQAPSDTMAVGGADFRAFVEAPACRATPAMASGLEIAVAREPSAPDDARACAWSITDPYRRHVMVCLHGYYDYLGRYTFNARARRLDDRWIAYDNQARPLAMSKAELRRRIRLVKSFGFRCGLYFADSLACDDCGPDFHSDWIWRAADGRPAQWYYWQKRPDKAGHRNYMLDPRHPEVRQWFLDYARALISCNWYPVKNRDYNRLAVEAHGRPQGLSNGYGDERGPADMPADILDEIIQRFLR
jgi:hypothetical protein